MEADCEALPSKARKRPAAARASSVTEGQCSGPRSFDEVMSWPDQVAADVLSFSPELHSNLLERLNEDLVVTTHYSGIGCAETALAMLRGKLHLDTSESSARVTPKLETCSSTMVAVAVALCQAQVGHSMSLATSRPGFLSLC